jgi:ankyrin repeat protein
LKVLGAVLLGLPFMVGCNEDDYRGETGDPSQMNGEHTAGDQHSAYGTYAILNGVGEGDPGPLISALDAGLDINQRDGGQNNETLFSHIVRILGLRNGDILRICIDAGADVDTTDDGGVAPLHWAVYLQPHEIRVLVDAGARVDVADRLGQTPLHWACKEQWSSSYENAECLVKAGADVNIHDGDGMTALHYAAAYQDAALVAMLTDAGADVNALDKHGMTPLHRACRRTDAGVLAAVKVLIEAGADMQLRDKDGDTPCDVAREAGHNRSVVDYMERIEQAGGE